MKDSTDATERCYSGVELITYPGLIRKDVDGWFKCIITISRLGLITTYTR